MPSLSRVIKGENVKYHENCICLPLIVVPAKEKKGSLQQEQLPEGEKPGFQPQQQTGETGPAEARRQAEEILENARRAAEAIVSEAREERRRLLEEAGAECKEIKEIARRTAYEEGLKSGREQGLAEGREEAARLHAEAERLLKETRSLRAKMLGRVEPQVVKLAVAIAEKLIQRELSQEPEIIAGMVHSALRQLQEKGEVIVRLHPEDWVYCREYLAEWQQEMRDGTTLSLLADGNMERGTYRVETDNSVVECRAKERLDDLRQALMEVTADD